MRNIDADVTLVNDHSCHHLTTLLHQPVVGRRSFRQLSVRQQEVLKSPVRFLRGKVSAITADKNLVTVQTREGKRELAYDFLVIALGWEPQFFHIPGLEEHALGVVNGHHISGIAASLLKDLIAYRYLYSIGGFRLAFRKFFEWMPYLADLHQD